MLGSRCLRSAPAPIDRPRDTRRCGMCDVERVVAVRADAGVVRRCPPEPHAGADCMRSFAAARRSRARGVERSPSSPAHTGSGPSHVHASTARCAVQHAPPRLPGAARTHLRDSAIPSPHRSRLRALARTDASARPGSRRAWRAVRRGPHDLTASCGIHSHARATGRGHRERAGAPRAAPRARPSELAGCLGSLRVDQRAPHVTQHVARAACSHVCTASDHCASRPGRGDRNVHRASSASISGGARAARHRCADIESRSVRTRVPAGLQLAHRGWWSTDALVARGRGRAARATRRAPPALASIATRRRATALLRSPATARTRDGLPVCVNPCARASDERRWPHRWATFPTSRRIRDRHPRASRPSASRRTEGGDASSCRMHGDRRAQLAPASQGSAPRCSTDPPCPAGAPRSRAPPRDECGFAPRRSVPSRSGRSVAHARPRGVAAPRCEAPRVLRTCEPAHRDATAGGRRDSEPMDPGSQTCTAGVSDGVSPHDARRRAA
jgi:hypothetical protein